MWEVSGAAIADLLGVPSISKAEIEADLAVRSDEGPIHCRFVEVIDTHAWTLRFWCRREDLQEAENRYAPPHAA